MAVTHDPANLGGSNKLLPLADAASVLAIEPDKLRRHWKRWGVGGVYKVGRELRFRERDLNAWLAKRAA